MNARGDKHFLAVEDGCQGVRAELARGVAGNAAPRLHRPAKLAVGDGALDSGQRYRRCIRRPAPALLDAQDRQHTELPAEDAPAECEAGPARDLDGPRPASRRSAPSTTGSSATRTSIRKRTPTGTRGSRRAPIRPDSRTQTAKPRTASARSEPATAPMSPSIRTTGVPHHRHRAPFLVRINHNFHVTSA